MNMQTEGISELSLAPKNYSVGAFQRQIGERKLKYFCNCCEPTRFYWSKN